MDSIDIIRGHAAARLTGSPARPRLRRRDLLALAAGMLCAPAARAAPLPTLRPGELVIGTYFDNPPFEFMQKDARVGFEVDLLTAVAGRLGLRPAFVATTWETILAQMQGHRYDCIVGGITITPRRRKILRWSQPYLDTTLSLIVDPARMPGLQTLADLAGRTVGVQAATTDYDAAVAMRQAGRIGAVKVYPFAHIVDAVADLRAGRIAAVMKVRPVAEYFLRHNPDLRMLAQVPDDPQPLGIGFAPGDAALRDAVDGALAALRNSGDIAALLRQWDISA